MILHYFKHRYGNLGDDLNPWLWRKLLPSLEDIEKDTYFVGIGTLLNHKLPEGKKIIFGTGFGYGPVPVVDENWHVYAVRGYGTARSLGLNEDLVITDAAVLLRATGYPKARPQHKIGFMPHVDSCWNGDWDVVCKELNIHYIDPSWGVDRVLLEMQACDSIIAEAMHGAIVADALRIPWSPVLIYDHILTSKWDDWLSTLDIEYAPQLIHPVWNVDRNLDFKFALTTKLKRKLIGIGVNSSNWTQPYPKSKKYDYQKTMLDISKVIQNDRFFLSKESILDRHVDKFQEKLELFKNDYGIK